MSLYTSNPQVRVTFYPQSADSLGEPIQFNIGINQYDDLISVQTRKDLRSPCGHFTITLAPRVTVKHRLYRQILRPGDLVVVEMGPDRPQPVSGYTELVRGQGYSGLEVVMIGTIDDVRETTSFSQPEGHPQRTVVISGRDLAKYFVDDQVWWDSWSQPARAIYGFSPEIDEWLRLKTDVNHDGKAAGLMLFLLKWLKQHFDIAFSFTRKKEVKLFADLLRVSLTLDSPVVASATSLESFQGSPWSLMERVASPPLYVLQYDVRRKIDIVRLVGGEQVSDNGNQRFWNSDNGRWDSQPALLLYRNPWSNRFYDDWTNLPTRVVRDSDLISMDLGRSNDEVSNTWRVWTDAQGIYKTQGGGDIGDARKLRDLDSIQRYGERPLQITTPFLSGQGGTDQLNLVRKYSFMLKDWNRWNEWFLNGTLTMKGMAAVRVGDRLWHWDHDFGDDTDVDKFEGGVDFYVESVTQDFRAFQGWTTSVQVTRGQPHREVGKLLLYNDVAVTEADLSDPQAASRRRLKELADQVAVWEQG